MKLYGSKFYKKTIKQSQFKRYCNKSNEEKIKRLENVKKIEEMLGYRPPSNSSHILRDFEKIYASTSSIIYYLIGGCTIFSITFYKSRNWDFNFVSANISASSLSLTSSIFVNLPILYNFKNTFPTLSFKNLFIPFSLSFLYSFLIIQQGEMMKKYSNHNFLVTPILFTSIASTFYLSYRYVGVFFSSISLLLPIILFKSRDFGLEMSKKLQFLNQLEFEDEELTEKLIRLTELIIKAPDVSEREKLDLKLLIDQKVFEYYGPKK